jgi:lipopolysaccharide/colanic/teichoic acid biosynthesis glycosyltransferase
MRIYPVIKRGLDVVLSGTALAALWPVMLAIATGIRASSPGPILFVQERAGRGGRPFSLLKFRTMHVANRRSLETSVNDPAVFRFGRLLREYHLDELPQLLNVLIGDMSLVGPRPTVASQVEHYTERERGRLRVRPGLTGLAQVSGNNLLSWDERIEIDLDYVRRASTWLDAKIVWRTIGTVLKKEGVYGADGVVRDKA